MSRQYAKLFGALVAAALMQVALAGATRAGGPYDDAMTAYEKGDYATALKILQPRAERGDSRSQNALGRMYAKGQGVPKDEAEASKWFQMATDQRKALEAYNYGDFALALKTFRPLAEKGQALAEYVIGLMYANGQGLPESYAEGLKWLTKSAEHGEAKAQFSVGVIYFKGLGIAKDPAVAFKWYRRAADQGNATAQFNLGSMYAKGQTVQQDVVTAQMLYSLAAAQGIKAAGAAKDRLAKSMTPEQLSEADKRARAWRPKLEED